MKRTKLLLSTIAAAVTFATTAQIDAPQPSPTAEIEQMVGLTEVEIEYSRPGMKDRAIFGNLVPYGEIWRTGANASTKITVGDNVTLGGKEVPAGKYALYTIPGKDSWTVIIYKDLENWGAGGYDQSKDLCRFQVKPTKLNDKVETFTIDFSDFTTNSANVNLSWENTRVSIPMVTPADELVEKQIKQVLIDGPGAGSYYSAAKFYLDKNKDLDQALEWINKAVELRPNAFWYIHVQAKVLAAQGKKKEAIAAANKSMEMAKNNEGGDFGYVKNNEDLIKKINGK